VQRRCSKPTFVANEGVGNMARGAHLAAYRVLASLVCWLRRLLEERREERKGEKRGVVKGYLEVEVEAMYGK
jgi:hypothetical protein